MVFPEKFVHTTYWHKIIWHTNQFGQLWTKLLTGDNSFYRILLSSSFYVIEWGLRIHNYVYGIKAAKLWLDSPDMLLKIVYLSIFMQKIYVQPKYLPILSIFSFRLQRCKQSMACSISNINGYQNCSLSDFSAIF